MLPTDSKERKATPLCTGVLDYFPDALAAVARLSKFGNDKHNPGQPMHWSRGKSSDHADCIVRHLVDRGKVDAESGMSHTVEVAWRALALLQEEIDEGKVENLPRGARYDEPAKFFGPIGPASLERSQTSVGARPPRAG